MNPEIPSPKTTSPKNGKAQIISLPPLPNGGISISDRKTRTSVPSAKIPVIKQKYVFISFADGVAKLPYVRWRCA
jgi:hypothetical protein